MDISAYKIIAMASLGLGSMVVGMVPAWICRNSERLNRSLLQSVLLCFGGGVLLATSLFHMLPEAKQSLPKFADVSFCGGFFLIYLLDELIHIVFGSTVDDFNDISYRPATDSDVNQQHHQCNHNNYRATESSPLVYGNDPIATGCHTNRREPCTRSSAGTGGLLIALSVHALIEGLAIGLQDLPYKVWLLLGAVASHKLVVGFCLGTELTAIETVSSGTHIFAIFVFSFGSVLGIGIGMIINETDQIVLGTMQALAGGTLLYVTLSEILPRERARWHSSTCSGILQFIAALLGTTMIYFINNYLDSYHIENEEIRPK